MELRHSPETKPSEKLESYISKGLDLIKKKKFTKAIDYFRDEEKAERFGFYIEDSRDMLVRSLNPQKEENIINFCAMNSFLKTSSSPALLISNVYFQNKVIPSQNLLHNLALIHAEEWTHGLQYKRGKNLTNTINDEIDVAKYFIQKEVPLTLEFMARHKRQQTLRI